MPISAHLQQVQGAPPHITVCGDAESKLRAWQQSREQLGKQRTVMNCNEGDFGGGV